MLRENKIALDRSTLGDQLLPAKTNHIMSRTCHIKLAVIHENGMRNDMDPINTTYLKEVTNYILGTQSYL